MSFAVGSLVRARNREWVVLPGSPGLEDDLLMARPLGGAEDEITGFLLSLEKVEPAELDLPDPERLGDYRSSRLLRDAARHHIIMRRGDVETTLLAEDCLALAFAGAPQSAEWLDAETAEAFLAAEPDANITKASAIASRRNCRRMCWGFLFICRKAGDRRMGFSPSFLSYIFLSPIFFSCGVVHVAVATP